MSVYFFFKSNKRMDYMQVKSDINKKKWTKMEHTT